MIDDAHPTISKRVALKFVVLLGLVSLFADMAHDGARSVAGPYLIELGASAFIVGAVVGFAEFLGYALRYVSGLVADRTGKYWTIMIIGYTCNLAAVPLLALAGHWQIAAAFMIVERIGKATHTPSRDVMLTDAGRHVGMGWTFGLHKALDQVGAMLGPLIIAGVLYFKGSYQLGFIVLLIPAIFAITTLLYARHLYPHSLEIKKEELEVNIKSQSFWLYFVSATLVAAGFANFPLIAFHFAKTNILPTVWIPIAYAIAMGVEAFGALWLGRLYDRFGFLILIGMTTLCSLFAPLVFLGHTSLCILGVVFWGVGVGAQESLMRAVIPKIVAKNKRASAYGIFYLGYGFFGFLGSATIGYLYDVSLIALVVFSMVSQLLAIPFLWKVMRTFEYKE